MEAPLRISTHLTHPIQGFPADALDIIFNLEVAYVARRVCRRWKEIADKRIIKDINKRSWWLSDTQLKSGEMRALLQVRGSGLQRLNANKLGFPFIKELIAMCPNLIQIAIHSGNRFFKDGRDRWDSSEAVNLQDLYTFPHLTNLTALFIEYTPIRNKGVKHILESPYMTNLATLHLQHVQMGEEGVRYIGDASRLSKLTRLVLSENRIGNGAFPAIGLSTSLKNLRILNLRDIGGGGPGTLFASSNLANLTELNVSKNEIGSASLRALADSPYVTALRTLNLENTRGIGDLGAQILATSFYLRLTSLNITWCGVRAEGVKALSQSPVLSNLKCYKHAYTDFETAEALCQETHMNQLREIHILQNRIGDKGLAAFANTAGFANLTYLDTWSNNIGDEGLVALAASQYVKQLRVFKCGQNREITIHGFRAWIHSPNTRNLREFDFNNNNKGPDFALALAESTQLFNLTDLNFGYNSIGNEGVLALMDAKCTNLMRLVLWSNGASQIMIDFAVLTSRIFRNLTELKL